jgi:DNA repair protein RAD50
LIGFQKSINDLKIRKAEIDRSDKELETYEMLQLEKKYSETEASIIEHKARLKSLQETIAVKSKTIKRLTDELSNEEGTKRNLQDNLELHKISMEKRVAETKLENLLKEIGELEPEKMFREKKKLRDERDNITAERQTLRGQITQSEDRVEAAKRELDEPKFKNARKNYLMECYKERTLKAMVSDLHKYRRALEMALLKFHADKMTQINQMIRELWNNIYKGNDIDYIKIKTDDEDAKTSSDKKRSYNYRVVQCKNAGEEIDMRGRCSAGQKVLASLIIRIALADTFSANCGILALDEPTTNLDSNNIHALCDALSRIIEDREKCGKFMLIIITHDEQFVTAMERAEKYFRLSRDSNGRSRIEMVDNN